MEIGKAKIFVQMIFACNFKENEAIKACQFRQKFADKSLWAASREDLRSKNLKKINV